MVEAAIRLVPTAALTASVLSLAWIERGSIAAVDWLPYALLAALVLSTVVMAGAALRPSRSAVVALGALLGLAVWGATSLRWSPAPSLARDEALLTAFYALAFATPILTLRSAFQRVAAVAVVVGGLVLLALATALALVLQADPDTMFHSGRLIFPVSYVNAQAAITLVGFWPAVSVAARPRAPIGLRALACGGAAALLAVALIAQSKGGGIALALSAVLVFALFPGRLRLLVPVAIAASVAAAAIAPLTAPFRAPDADALLRAAERAGLAALAVAAVATCLGLLYVLIDRRLTLPGRARKVAGALVLAALASSLAAGTTAFFVRVDEPRAFVESKWHAFKSLPATEDREASHFFSLGSNRYDFLRVSLEEFKRRPLAGIGARGFRAAYLEKGRSQETPARAHSLPLELLAEEGIVGFALLVIAVGLPLALAARRRAGLAALAAFGAASYWLVHASGDWIWTVPATGIAVFLLLGISASEVPKATRLPRPARWFAAPALLALAALAFVPPWLSGRLTAEALATGSTRPLESAQRLDPLSVAPFTAAAVLAETPARAIPPLERAAQLEPRSAGVQYLLGRTYLEVGRRSDAQERLGIARRLYPRDPVIAETLRRATH
jgi:hypothetical protein